MAGEQKLGNGNRDVRAEESALHAGKSMRNWQRIKIIFFPKRVEPAALRRRRFRGPNTLRKAFPAGERVGNGGI
jgi:hypothetical protein